MTAIWTVPILFATLAVGAGVTAHWPSDWRYVMFGRWSTRCGVSVLAAMGSVVTWPLCLVAEWGAR